MSDRISFQLTDDGIEQLVRDRAGVGAPTDLTDAIVRLASAMPQRKRSWLGLLDVREVPRSRVMLAAALLALAIVGAAFAIVGSGLLQRADLRVPPSPPGPSVRAIASEAPPPVPSPSTPVEPPPSPAPPAPGTVTPAACGLTPPSEPRVTSINIPPHAYLRVTFAGCSVWVTNNRNGHGIHRVDIAKNKFVETILKGPIANPVFALRSDGGDLWALTWDDPAPLRRIDPATGKPDKSIALAQGTAAGGLWILGGELWAGPRSWRPSRAEVNVIDLDTGAIISTIKDLVPFEMWRDATAVWAIARPSDAATAAREGDMDLVRIDPVTFDVTRVPLPREIADVGYQPTLHAGDLYFPILGEIVQVSTATGSVTRRITLDHADMGAKLVSTGNELWALPIESKPLRNGFNNRSRELVQIDPDSGSIVRRVPIREIGAMDLLYGYGSLWVLAPDADYTRTFGMHLVRVELPVPA